MVKKKNNILTASRYSKLLADVRKLIEGGRQRAAEALSQELVNTYWLVGQRIEQEGLTDRAHYGQAVLQDLSNVLDVPLRTLQQSVAFFKAYKTTPRGRNLKWAHYRELVGMRSVAERRWYEEQVSMHKLTRDQLLVLIKKGAYQENLLPLDQKKIKQLKRPIKPSYVYKAMVERVVDGDTLLLRMDLGFQVFKEQRIRLAQINAPEIDTEEGRKAYEYLRNRLAEVDFVIVKTHMIDIYGRFLGDVFYSHKLKHRDNVFLNGEYLNQELIDEGLVSVL
ncbi:hypothetical protein MNBD_UNCLBAC01-949 [hydrothermal vent metagenome]|uniref:TNase-like domain-containing protein n=1 Tax=hydrothermal vent metagenome TaxID=652676 RepID=A0A3B1DEB7_9ZZZZ